MLKDRIKIGFQTIICGNRIADFSELCLMLNDFGFHGIEIAQHPSTLPNIESLLSVLEKDNFQMSLIGLAGGNLEERIKYCNQYKPEYLYIKNWNNSDCSRAITAGYTLGLHPHVYAPMDQIVHASKVMKDHQDVKFILDTAHLTIAREDPILILSSNYERIASIHLKDWTSKFGRSPHHYAKGFVELGRGEVILDAILEKLDELGYSGWLILEQDRTDSDPFTSTKISAEWLQKRGFSMHVPPSRIYHIDYSLGPPRESERGRIENELKFYQSAVHSRYAGINHYFYNLAKSYNEIIKSNVINVWTCSPSNSLLNLLAVWSSEGQPKMEMQSTLKLDEVLTGITYSRQAVTHFDLCKQYEGKTFGNPELMAQYKPDKMISIPLLNPNNLDHVQYIINIFPLRDAELMDDETLNELSFVAAIGAQSVVDEYCSNSVAEINYIFSRYKSVSSFIEAFVSFIKDHIDCEGVSVFLVNDLQNRLELRGTTGIEWHVPPEERFYKIGEGHTGKTWKTGRTLLTIELKDDVAHIAKSTEIVKYQQVRSCLFAPFFDPYGNVFGVIRCNNKKSLSFPGKFCSFSEIDLAIMDSICQAAAPFMNVLIEKERRFRALGRLTHELKVPVIAIRGATQSIISEARNKLVFEFDYPGDIWSWTELMQRLLDVSDFMRFRFEEIKLSLSPTLLMKEVVAPAIRQIGYLLKAKDMSIHAIHYQGFDQIPRLWIDKNMFQQVFFNLLSNAIKFSYDDPSSFRVEISGFSTNEGFGIKFQDWGEGILLGTEKVIFEEGIRGPTSLSKGVASQGLGLWLCKEIIALHGGIISVTNLSLPTEFTILLPEELSKAKRSDYRKESRI